MVNYTYSKLPTINFNTTPASIARSATGSVYAIGDTTYTTPLNMTLVVGGSVVTSISSDANGLLPDFTLLDRTSCVWKQAGVSFATVLTTSDPVPGPAGATGGTGATGAQGVPGDVSTWKPTTFYPLNTPVANPSGDLVKVTTAHTSTGSYDAAKFTTAYDSAVQTLVNTSGTATQVALSATYVPVGTSTTVDTGSAKDANRVLTGVNRSAAGGSAAVVRGEAQAASMLLNNNTGTDLSLTHAYEAVQFTAPAGTTTFGAIKVRLKVQAGTTSLASITASVYNDVAGAPGTIQALNNGQTVVYASTLSTTFAVTEFLVRVNGASPTNYWIVFQTAGVSAGGFVLDSAATGSGAHAYSTNGTAWTASTSKPYLELRGQTHAGIQGTSENYVGVRGDSVTYYGLYGNTVHGIGSHGSSTNGVGVEGISVTGTAGVVGIGQNGYGVKGDGTNAPGVYGSSSNAAGVVGVSANANQPAMQGDSTNTGAGIYGTNNSTGPGIKAESLSGNGPAIHAIGHFKSTFGYPASAAAGANAGTTPPAPVLAWPGSNDVRGTVTWGTGTTPAAGAQVVVTFGKAYAVAPTVILSGANAATMALQPYVSAVSTGSFTVSFSLAPAASQANTVYAASYMAME